MLVPAGTVIVGTIRADWRRAGASVVVEPGRARMTLLLDVAARLARLTPISSADCSRAPPKRSQKWLL
jgi:hypothetical protein